MKNNKKGMAMIAALMTAFLFLALVSTLCLLATSGTRRANYAKKVTIALHLAEAGIADALYPTFRKEILCISVPIPC